ncbi:MAG: hypothetical protein NTX79_04285 [Candidatus Micrarchaeota archaeon]|nr:hypothetical protein [Candidatus Micrarchaeota archaeon]
MTKNGRILDREFEEGITGRASELQREARDAITVAQNEAQRDITMAQKYAHGKNDEVEAMIKEHPKAFVLGSFIGGVALGTLLARGNR